MSPSGSDGGWGPRPAPKSTRSRRRWALALFFGLLIMPGKTVVIVPVAIGLAGMLAYRIYRAAQAGRGWWRRWHPQPARDLTGDGSLAAVREQVAARGGGAFLGASRHGEWRLARPERAVLVLGPPRSGKSSGLTIPTVLTCPGPVVSTSTKPDVLAATVGARSELGRVWEFAPPGPPLALSARCGGRRSPARARGTGRC